MNNYIQQPQQSYIIPPPLESVVHVNSEQEMLNYPIAPGNTVYFIHDSMGVIYKRGVNIYGTQAIPEIYDFKKREQTQMQQQNNVTEQTQEYMTKKDVEDLILDILGRKEAGNAK